MNASKPARFLCMGVVVMDILASPVERLPEAEKALWFDDIAIASGGCAANTAHALSRLGGAVSLVGRIGDDVFGRMVRSSLQKERIDLSWLEIDDERPTSVAVVLVDERHERRFLHRAGAGAQLQVPGDLPLSEFDYIHLGGCFLVPGCMGEPLVDLFARARQHGIVTSIDTVWGRHDNWRDILSALPHTDYFVPSLLEAQMITGHDQPESIAQFLLDNGAGCVVIKLGDQGSYMAKGDRREKIPPYVVPAAKMIDTTGAGDAFVAGFLKGVSLGWSPADAARLGNACGALATTTLGAPMQSEPQRLVELIAAVENRRPIF